MIRIELTTICLEGRSSTAELHPQLGKWHDWQSNMHSFNLSARNCSCSYYDRYQPGLHSEFAAPECFGADDEIRTHDIFVGNEMLYH